ncbi:MAG: hypothetical protein WBO10_03485 [Pyrinomonadaceae bacterium]
MGIVFADVVEDVKLLAADEKEELRNLIDSYLIEERREEISKNYETSRLEVLESSSDIARLKQLIND